MNIQVNIILQILLQNDNYLFASELRINDLKRCLNFKIDHCFGYNTGSGIDQDGTASGLGGTILLRAKKKNYENTNI
jgi:hypothetical protein